ncbi:uncharacterized protein LOC141860865 isoform X5 [Acropora palmata]|uniref:uncharacterized protein LOC141860865 isoform X5 n=1 Tax=Acropora palmata TaxID=6131 RepID=UPI003DA13352
MGTYPQDLLDGGSATVPGREMAERCSSSPPQLSVMLKQAKDIQILAKHWDDVDHGPIDILLVTAEECEFLSCLPFLEQLFKSYIHGIGFVYFGCMGGASSQEKLKVALMSCSKGSATPRGSLTVAQSAIRVLQPKAVVSVGICTSLVSEKVRMGDVVIPSKLISAEGLCTPISPCFGDLARDAPYGWVAPLKNQGELEVKVHCDGDILSQSLTEKCQYDDIFKHYPGAVASDTEGKGVYSAAYDANIEWVIVKGVARYFYQGQSATSEWMSFASTMAASVVAKMLNDPTVFQKWAHYNQGNIFLSPQGVEQASLAQGSSLLRSGHDLESAIGAQSMIQHTENQEGTHIEHGDVKENQERTNIEHGEVEGRQGACGTTSQDQHSLAKYGAKKDRPIMCKEKYHGNERVQYYCLDCEVPICHKCAQTRHNHHQKEDIQQVAEEINSQRREILAKAEEQISIIEANIKEQNRLMRISEQEVVEAKNRVATSVERFVQRLREHEVKTREKLDSINKTQKREHQKRLEKLQSSASRLKSAIAKDKDLSQQRRGVEILEIENKDFNVQEEELNNVRMEIYKARHVDYVWNDRTSKDVKTCHILEDQIIVSHTDVSQTTVEGRGLGEVELGVTAEFIITTRDSEGRQVYDKDDRVDVTITCIKTETSKDIVEDCKDGTYIVRYSPISAGFHRVAIEVNGRPLTASPWLVQVAPHRYKDVDRFCGEGLSAFAFPWSVAVNERTGQMAIAGYSSKRIQLFDKEWKYQKTIGGDCEFQRQRRVRNALDIGHPISVAFLRNDDIVFSRERIAHKEQMSVFTVRGEFINRFSDHLVRPLSVFVKTEDDGQVIVSDVGDKKIKVLSPDGKDLLQSFSPPDCQETAEFIVYHNSLFFASYQREHCVKVFKNEGTYLYDIGRAGVRVPVGQELRNPVGVAVDKFNQVIICDNGNYRVQAFTLDGHFLYSITDEMHMIESPWFAALIGDGDKLLITDVAVGAHCIYVFK